jgi:cell division septum initiation protein DivIVA
MAPDEPTLMSISSNTSLSADEIARRTFPPARRGVDGEAVRRFLENVADEIRSLNDREAQLRRRVLDAERRASEPPVLDQETLMRAVGAETARVLQSANDAARDVVARAEEAAAEMLADTERVASERAALSEEEATALVQGAADEAAAIEAAALADAAAIREAAQAEAAVVTGSAQAEAGSLLDATKQQSRQALSEARERRRAVLADLAAQRRALYVQLEQLRSGRDYLVEVVDAVGDAVDELRERLHSAEHDARVAAAQAGDRAENEVLDDVETLLESDFFDRADEDAPYRAEAVERAVASPAAAAEFPPAEFPPAAPEFPPAEVPTEDETTLDASTLLEAALLEIPAPETPALAVAAETDVPHRSVDQLFAKIRASREPSPGDGEPQDDTGPEATVETNPPAAPLVAVEPSSSDADAAALGRRAEVLAPVVTRLSRALKRTLQDDQNELLNAIRHASGSPDLETLLPEATQRERYALAASGPLADGWLVGRAWLEPEEPADAVSAATDRGREFGAQLAEELVGLLRHRLSESLSALAEIGDGASDAAGAAYREWKGSRIEGSAGDFATRAFAAGAVVAGEGVIVRWIVDDGGQPCPDCEDNALAGDQLAGDAFPTGQVHPPVHPGCRCLLVPSS